MVWSTVHTVLHAIVEYSDKETRKTLCSVNQAHHAMVLHVEGDHRHLVVNDVSISRLRATVSEGAFHGLVVDANVQPHRVCAFLRERFPSWNTCVKAVTLRGCPSLWPEMLRVLTTTEDSALCALTLDATGALVVAPDVWTALADLCPRLHTLVVHNLPRLATTTSEYCQYAIRVCRSVKRIVSVIHERPWKRLAFLGNSSGQHHMLRIFGWALRCIHYDQHRILPPIPLHPLELLELDVHDPDPPDIGTIHDVDNAIFFWSYFLARAVHVRVCWNLATRHVATWTLPFRLVHVRWQYCRPCVDAMLPPSHGHVELVFAARTHDDAAAWGPTERWSEWIYTTLRRFRPHVPLLQSATVTITVPPPCHVCEHAVRAAFARILPVSDTVRLSMEWQ